MKIMRETAILSGKQELRSVRNVLEELQRQLSGLREEGGERDTRFAGRLVEAGKEVEELRSGLEEQWKRQEPPRKSRKAWNRRENGGLWRGFCLYLARFCGSENGSFMFA